MPIKLTTGAFYLSGLLFRSDSSQSIWTKLNYLASQKNIKMIDINKLQAPGELIYVIKVKVTKFITL